MQHVRYRFICDVQNALQSFLLHASGLDGEQRSLEKCKRCQMIWLIIPIMFGVDILLCILHTACRNWGTFFGLCVRFSSGVYSFGPLTLVSI